MDEVIEDKEKRFIKDMGSIPQRGAARSHLHFVPNEFPKLVLSSPSLLKVEFNELYFEKENETWIIGYDTSLIASY